MSPRIEITVTPAGETSVETKSFAGPSCRTASQPYEEALGTTSSERLTPEYHAAVPVAQSVEQRA
ncbi:DUF2997 domain-containing protein [Alienimonas californiensis]|uniref:DUF2997 domain-containing protein n=1 Tax=Alienimonas californiensis TaxID=2527989 RepID=A0A517P497_9PLAN|nr:DUF2997 domain-containing protein [Alienimonas californiensis]QDT14208.1 hypothetical protein CA12_02770 [Alienimonas californiensis]